MTSSRALALLSALAVALVVAVSGPSAGAGRAADAISAGASGRTLARSIESRITTLERGRLAQSAISWHGGPILTSTGETVTVLVSDSLTAEQASPESWAEFLAGLVHGPELAQLTMHVAPLTEVHGLCGFDALGCYRRNTAVAIGETLPDGTTGEEVMRHEYGHHIALYRSNPPWEAIDWGPKRWASAANVCARVARNEAFPGDEGRNYAQNPGEAWAEVYRLLNERKAGITSSTWRIIAPSFFPDDAALQAAEQDVVSPWTAGQTTVKRRLVRKGGKWWIPLTTPLDGTLTVRATLPRGGRHDVALVAPNRRTALKRVTATGGRTRNLTSTVCGQRSLFVRVTQKGAVGQVAVSVTTP